MTTFFFASVGLVSVAILAGSELAKSTSGLPRPSPTVNGQISRPDASTNQTLSADRAVAQAIRPTRVDREEAALPEFGGRWQPAQPRAERE